MRPPSPALVAAASLATVLLVGSGTATAATPTVAPDDAAADAEVALLPAAVRTPDGRAAFDLVLDPDAPGDVVATTAVHEVDTDGTGEVRAGAARADASVTRGRRLRPGEQFRVDVTVPDDLAAAVLVVDVTAAGALDVAASEPVRLTSLVLVGGVGPPPELELSTGGDEVVATITSGAPLLLSASLTGGEQVVASDRLVLPDQPVSLRVPAARWPAPVSLAVTDELGRASGLSRGAGVFTAMAAVLVVLAAALLRASVRRRRRRQP